jgi:hypothetical protein
MLGVGRMLAATAVLASLLSTGKAADIIVHEGSILLVGRIEAGDDEKFRRTVVAEIRRRGHEKPPVSFLHIYSPGGNLSAALKIGEQVHLLQLETVAPTMRPHVRTNFATGTPIPDTRLPQSEPRSCDLPGERERRERVSDEHRRHLDAMIEARKKKNYKYAPFDGQFETFDPKSQRGDARCECTSACFFIWAAGAVRFGDVVGVHRPTFDPTEFSKLSASEARARYDALTEASKSYLTKIGISQELINRVFATSSTNIAYLSQQELGMLRRSPHLEELLIAKCGRLITLEELQTMTTEEKVIF